MGSARSLRAQRAPTASRWASRAARGTAAPTRTPPRWVRTTVCSGASTPTADTASGVAGEAPVRHRLLRGLRGRRGPRGPPWPSTSTWTISQQLRSSWTKTPRWCAATPVSPTSSDALTGKRVKTSHPFSRTLPPA